MLSRTVVTTALLAVSASGCADSPAVELSVQHVGRRQADRIAATLGVTNGDGGMIDLAKARATVTVETRLGQATWTGASDVIVDWTSPPLIDVIVVADNSGSESGHLAEIQDAIQHFGHVILARAHDDRVGINRVSTQAKMILPLSSDDAAVDAAADALFVSNGWTALWDGVRQANEALEADRVTASNGVDCYAGSAPSIVLFTDGKDNNSSNEHSTSYDDDGVNTTLDGLLALEVAGIRTPIYTIGVGDRIDDTALEHLADATGGKHASIANYGQLVGALHGAAAKLDAVVPVCFVPASCTDDQAHLTITIGNDTHDAFVAIAPGC